MTAKMSMPCSTDGRKEKIGSWIESEEKKPFGRPRRRWEYIRRNLQNVGIRDEK